MDFALKVKRNVHIRLPGNVGVGVWSRKDKKMITENEIEEVIKDYFKCMGLTNIQIINGKSIWIDGKDVVNLAFAIMDKIKERDIDKESEMLRERAIYEEESGLLEEDKI